MKESQLWAHMKGHWRNRGHLVRVENAATFGTPDCNCCVDGQEFWIEHKEAKNWVTSIRTTQLAWIISRIKAKGNIFFMVSMDNDVVIYPGNCILDTGVIISKNAQTYLNFKNTSELYRIPTLGDWDAMLEFIIYECKRKETA